MLFIAEMLYEAGLSLEALQGKSLPSDLRGELSRLATLNGTGDTIFMCALATPKRVMAKTPQVLRFKGMLMFDAGVWVRVILAGGVLALRGLGQLIKVN